MSRNPGGRVAVCCQGRRSSSEPRTKGIGIPTFLPLRRSGVLSKPNDGTVAVQRWTDQTAMRAARQYLVGQGADPDRHDVVVFVHSQQVQRKDGSTKVEEAVHILWSRNRDDGLLHDNDHAFVSAAVARARYDVYAGIDPARNFRT